MRTKLCQIRWHPDERDGGKNAPIMATDFAPVSHNAPHPSLPTDTSTTPRIVATASQDGSVRLWKLLVGDSQSNTTTTSTASTTTTTTSDNFRIEHVLDFEGHSMSVNAVRFSPNGECVATGGDDGYVIVWYRTTKPLDSSVLPAKSWNEVTSARQLQRVILRGKLSEICDLSWTKDSKYIITGSVDGTVGVWDVCASKIFHQMKDHKGFVQGVACDPRGEYFSSQCASRTCRMHKVDLTKKMGRSMFKTVSTLRSRQVKWDPVPANDLSKKKSSSSKNTIKTTNLLSTAMDAVIKNTTGGAAGTTNAATTTTTTTPIGTTGTDVTVVRAMHSHALYLDNISTTTFFRRPTWTVDGSLLITPTGQFKAGAIQKYENTTYLFARNQWDSPVAHFPLGQAMPSVGVRCNPILFELRKDKDGTISPKPLIKLPYRMILAILSTNAIMIYDTQHSHMVSIVRNQHCANLTDIAWSNDGATLFVTSSDGFCSVIEFAENELGIPCPRNAYPTSMTECEMKPWFELRAKERAADKIAAATEAAAAAVTGKKHKATDPTLIEAAKVNKTGNSKKRRVTLVALNPTEAAAATSGNLLG